MLDRYVILLESYSQSVEFRKKLADLSDLSLGLTCSTPNLWLEELWLIGGSGERFVTSLERKLIVRKLLKKSTTIVNTSGIVDAIAEFLSIYFGLAEYQNILKEFQQYAGSFDQRFTEKERSLLSFSCAYGDELKRLCLIEPSSAAEQLRRCASRLISSQSSTPSIIFAPLIDPLEFYLERLIQESGALLISDIAQFKRWVFSKPSAQSDAHLEQLLKELLNTLLPFVDDLSVASACSVVFDRPTGKTAQGSLLIREIDTLVQSSQENASLLVAAQDPQALTGQLIPAISDKDVVVEVCDSFPFSQTEFGQAYLGLANFFRQENLDLSGVIDFIKSSFSGLGKLQALRLQNYLLSDRSFTSNDVLTILRQNIGCFEYFEELFEQADASILFGFFEEKAYVYFSDSQQCSKLTLELNAIRFVRSCYEEARFIGISVEALGDLLDRAQISRSFMVGEGSLRVRVEPLSQASCHLPSSYNCIFMADLENETFNAHSSENPLESFIKKCNLPLEDAYLKKVRARFSHFLSASADRIVLVSPQHTIDSLSLEPAFFCEEFLFELDRRGQSYVWEEEGEQDLSFNLALRKPKESFEHVVVPSSYLSEEMLERLGVARKNSNGETAVCLSPSALELYVHCPYRWFAERRLHLDDPGEDFGPIEKGSFVHRFFEEFYAEIATLGHDRVTHDNLPLALEIFEELFVSSINDQRQRPVGDRYLAVTALEKQEYSKLHDQLRRSIELQADLLPGFHPVCHEFDIKVDSGLVFAGANMQGRIDRIDVDDRGHFVVIDYKGSIVNHEAGYQIDDEEPLKIPYKIQGLIYACLYSQLRPELHPQGALYLSYRADSLSRALKGSLSEALSDEVPIAKSNIVLANFDTYLELIEEALVAFVERLKAGYIAPDPLMEKACEYCPVTDCPRRR